VTRRIPLTAVPVESGCNYPSPFDRLCLEQSTQRLARHAGLIQFGVNLTVIEPGAWSSHVTGTAMRTNWFGCSRAS
jgi:uncharacterized cupin superfamily protein